MTELSFKLLLTLEYATVEFAVYLRKNAQLKAGITYFREKVASLNDKNREQEFKIVDLEVEILSVHSSTHSYNGSTHR